MGKKEEIITVRPNTLRSENTSVLSMNEQRILFYGIYKIQSNATSVTFTKQEMELLFGVDFGSWKEIKKYLYNLRNFGMDSVNEKTQRITIVNAFVRLDYDNGVFIFKFTEDFLPAINNQKRFLQYGMKSIGKFHCKYSIYLYDFLKDNMWGDISLKRNISLKEFKSIFKLDDCKYKGRNANFKSRVWKPAMDEINAFTDYNINIVSTGRGDSITYNIHRIINEDLNKSRKLIQLNKFECKLGKNIIDNRCSECMKINLCPMKVNNSWYESELEYDKSSPLALASFMNNTFWSNRYYSLSERIKNNVACDLEKAYYHKAIDKAKVINRLSGNDEEMLDEEEILNAEKQFFKDRVT